MGADIYGRIMDWCHIAISSPVSFFLVSKSSEGEVGVVAAVTVASPAAVNHPCSGTRGLLF